MPCPQADAPALRAAAPVWDGLTATEVDAETLGVWRLVLYTVMPECLDVLAVPVPFAEVVGEEEGVVNGPLRLVGTSMVKHADTRGKASLTWSLARR